MESVVPAWAAGDAASPPPAWSDTERSDRRSAAVALRPPRWKRRASKRMPSPGLSGQMASCRPSRRRARRSASESACHYLSACHHLRVLHLHLIIIEPEVGLGLASQSVSQCVSVAQNFGSTSPAPLGVSDDFSSVRRESRL